MVTFESEQELGGQHAWRLIARGDLDAVTVAEFDERLDSIISQGARFVVLDLAGVSFLDSTGLRSIVRASGLLAGLGGRLTVAGLSGAAERVLELTGLLEGLRDNSVTDS